MGLARQCPVHKNLSAPKSSQPCSFEMLYPIMARLPKTIDIEEQKPDYDAAYYDANREATTPGTLEYDESYGNIRYTQSRLPYIDDASKELWVALHNFHPLSASYAGNFQSRIRGSHKQKDCAVQASVCPMRKGGSSLSALNLIRKVFNWDDLILHPSTEGTFYGVVFRSKRAPNSDDETLGLMTADKLSHEEAVNAGGLLMYWYGVPDPITGSNLATCIWSSREEARAASSLPLHKQAVKRAMIAYEDFELSRYKVVKLAGETSLRIEEWSNT